MGALGWLFWHWRWEPPLLVGEDGREGRGEHFRKETNVCVCVCVSLTVHVIPAATAIINAVEFWLCVINKEEVR